MDLKEVKKDIIHTTIGDRVAIPKDTFNWLIKQAELTDIWKQRYFDENKKVLDMIYEKTKDMKL